MKACILAVGTELLFGQITNTNATYLSQQLNNLGIDVLYHRTVGDNPERLKKQIIEIYEECNLILVTGGLGPTQDDLTKETITSIFKKELILNEVEFENLKNIFDKRNLDMAESNIKQVMLPKNSIILHNTNGTAPGFILEAKRRDILNNSYLENNKEYLDETCIIVSMPGPPREMKPMYKNFVAPFLKKHSKQATCYKFIRTIGIGESDLEKKISHLLEDQSKVTIAPYASLGEVYLRITAKSEFYEDAEKLVDNRINDLLEIIGDYVYSLDNKKLEEVVFEKLLQNSLTISSAESCTGGLFAQRLTAISGASQIFNRGFVTYSNESKIEDLGVSRDTIKYFGAVSSETAIEMARGVKKNSNTNIGISVTGIAGPSSDNTNKEIGLVNIGIAYNDNVKSYKYNFSGNREDIRNRSVLAMFHILYNILKEEV